MRPTIRAVVFDMDGVLLDSEPLHHRAVNELLSEEGYAGLSFDDYVPYMGTTDEYTWKDLIRRFALPRACEYYLHRYNATVLELYRLNSELAPGASELLTDLKRRGLGLAVASSSRQAWVETCLTSLGIRDYFNIVVSGEMVKRSKPDPEIFLLAAKSLGVAAGACLAIEDSPNGVAAALTAGMLTVAIASPYPTASETSGAHVRLTTLADFDRALLDSGRASQPQAK